MSELPQALFRRWMHVPEEQSGDTSTYRPASHPLPPARGRGGIELRPDGTYVDVRPGPVDAPVTSESRTWSSDGPRHLRLHDSSGRIHRELEIADVDDDVLRLRPINPEAFRHAQ